MKPQYVLPVVIFMAIAVALFYGLFINPSQKPFALEGKPVPAFDLAPVVENGPGLATADLAAGEVTLINFFATWCAPCRAEHPLLMQLAARDDITIHGIDYKDRMEAAQLYLKASGNPFTRTGFDDTGRTGIDWGLSGVPETFVVDRAGNIVWRWQGALNDAVIANSLLPLLEKLQSDQVQP
ncbi:MAG: DsbE family thiol:disulfide interchange protein [Proteobacteria bacterium]|nr:DsbE family thiol:disulfide interchange protein [Pseudomonadota bacterium]